MFVMMNSSALSTAKGKDLDHYETAIINAYGIKKETQDWNERRPRSTKLVPANDLMYCKVKMELKGGKSVALL